MSVVAWTASLPGPWGPIHLAVSSHGIVAVAWLTTDDDVDEGLTRRLHGTVVPLSTDPGGVRVAHMADAVRAVEAVLAGRPHAPVRVDLRDRPDWDQAVLQEVRRIPLGATASYPGSTGPPRLRGAETTNQVPI